MAKPPRELTKQIEIVSGVIASLSDLVDIGKIKVEHYGKDFLDPLNEIRTKALELRNDLEVFKGNMTYAVSTQYSTNDRFASVSAGKVIERFLQR